MKSKKKEIIGKSESKKPKLEKRRLGILEKTKGFFIAKDFNITTKDEFQI